MALADRAERSELLRIEEQKRKAATAASMSNDDDIEDDGPTSPHPQPESGTTVS
jgi:hypothetical protein